MFDVTRYMWTATGLRPSEIEHGPVRFIRETDYDALRATVARLEGALERIADKSARDEVMELKNMARTALEVKDAKKKVTKGKK